jgi:hypothetical protein
MFQQFRRFPVFYKGYGDFGYGDGVQGGVEAGIAVDLVKIPYRNMIAGTFIFYQVFRTEDGGNILLDGDILELFDDDKVDSERFAGKLKLRDKFEYILVLLQFELKSLNKGRVPGQGRGGGAMFAVCAQRRPLCHDIPTKGNFL